MADCDERLQKEREEMQKRFKKDLQDSLRDLNHQLYLSQCEIRNLRVAEEDRKAKSANMFEKEVIEARSLVSAEVRETREAAYQKVQSLKVQHAEDLKAKDHELYLSRCEIRNLTVAEEDRKAKSANTFEKEVIEARSLVSAEVRETREAAYQKVQSLKVQHAEDLRVKDAEILKLKEDLKEARLCLLSLGSTLKSVKADLKRAKTSASMQKYHSGLLKYSKHKTCFTWAEQDEDKEEEEASCSSSSYESAVADSDESEDLAISENESEEEHSGETAPDAAGGASGAAAGKNRRTGVAGGGGRRRGVVDRRSSAGSSTSGRRVHRRTFEDNNKRALKRRGKKILCLLHKLSNGGDGRLAIKILCEALRHHKVKGLLYKAGGVEALLGVARATNRSVKEEFYVEELLTRLGNALRYLKRDKGGQSRSAEEWIAEQAIITSIAPPTVSPGSKKFQWYRKTFHLGYRALESGIRRRQLLDNSVLREVTLGIGEKEGEAGEEEEEGHWFARQRAKYANSIRQRYPVEAGIATGFWVSRTVPSPSEVLVKHAKFPHPYKSRTERYKMCPPPSAYTHDGGDKGAGGRGGRVEGCSEHAKHYKTMSDDKMYDDFCEEHPEEAKVIKRYMFKALRPWFIGLEDRRTCVCVYCKRMLLVLKAYKKNFRHYHGEDCSCCCDFCKDGGCRNHLVDGPMSSPDALMRVILCPLATSLEEEVVRTMEEEEDDDDEEQDSDYYYSSSSGGQEEHSCCSSHYGDDDEYEEEAEAFKEYASSSCSSLCSGDEEVVAAPGEEEDVVMMEEDKGNDDHHVTAAAAAEGEENRRADHRDDEGDYSAAGFQRSIESGWAFLSERRRKAMLMNKRRKEKPDFKFDCVMGRCKSCGWADEDGNLKPPFAICDTELMAAGGREDFEWEEIRYVSQAKGGVRESELEEAEAEEEDSRREALPSVPLAGSRIGEENQQDGTKIVTTVTVRGSANDFYKYAQKTSQVYFKHIWRKRNQEKVIAAMTQSLKDDELLFHLDFGMNYSHTHHDAIQAEHWSQWQSTLLVIVVYRRVRPGGAVQAEAHVFLSPDRNHSNQFVQHSMGILMKHYQTGEHKHFTNIKRIKLVSDGCKSQFKCRFQFNWLCECPSLFTVHEDKEGGGGEDDVVVVPGPTAEHHFWAEGHGKGLCDAITGYLKQIWGRVEIRRGAYFPDSKALYEYSVKNLSKIPPPPTPNNDDGGIEPGIPGEGIRARFFHLVDFGDVDQEPGKTVEAMKGTAKCFSFIAPGEEGKAKIVYMREGSCICEEACLKGDFQNCKHQSLLPQPEEVAVRAGVWSQEEQRRAVRKLREAAELELQGKKEGDTLLIYFTQYQKGDRGDDPNWKSRWAPVELARSVRVNNATSQSRQNPQIGVYIPEEVVKESEFCFPSDEVCDKEIQFCGTAVNCNKKHVTWVPIECVRASPACGLPDFSEAPVWNPDNHVVEGIPPAGGERRRRLPLLPRSSTLNRRSVRRGLPSKIYIPARLQQHMLESLRYWEKIIPLSQL
jgi:hypothetical protein